VVQIKVIRKVDLIPLQALEMSLTSLKSDQTVFFQVLDLNWRSPKSGGVFSKSRQFGKMPGR
jgi:hypothetical protein